MYIFKKPKPLGKAKKRSKENLRLLNMLNRYITDTSAVPVSVLTRFWADQAAAITYKEIRKLIEEEEVSEEDLLNWSKDYSSFVTDTLEPMWLEAIIVGQLSSAILNEAKEQGFEFDATDVGIRNWIKNRGSEFVTNAVQEQKKAIQRLTMKAVREEMSPVISSVLAEKKLSV